MAKNNELFGWDGGNRVVPLDSKGLPIVKPKDDYGQMLRRVEKNKQKPKKKA